MPYVTTIEGACVMLLDAIWAVREQGVSTLPARSPAAGWIRPLSTLPYPVFWPDSRSFGQSTTSRTRLLRPNGISP